MQVTIYPSTLSGKIKAPPSKSLTIRAYAAALLAGGISKILNPSACTDAKTMLSVVQQAGAEITTGNNQVSIKGSGQTIGGKIHCGESALAARLMLAIATLSSKQSIIAGSGALLQRALGDIALPMRQLGVKYADSGGLLPAKVKGPASGGQVVVDGSLSSQFVSGLLMTLPMLHDDSELTVNQLKSAPYVELTLEMLNHFGVNILKTDDLHFTIKGRQQYQPATITIEGDWSGAAFLICAAAIGGNLTLKGLNPKSKQADAALFQLFGELGIHAHFQGDDLFISSSAIPAFVFDCSHCPDLVPALSVLAAKSSGICRLTGTGRLKEKESDRAAVLKKELGKLGVRILLNQDEMIIYPGKISGGEISSHHDHRIAMACAVAALSADSPVTITEADCVAKSFPTFWDEFRAAGAKISSLL
jgi:3-phosphoshikimate 1-carboxyvinyltransferase